MDATRLTTGIRRAIAATTLLGYLAGCTGWHDIGTIAPAPAPQRPQFLRVTLLNGSRLELRNARIVGDSVVGEVGAQAHRERTSIAVRDIKQIDNRKVSGGNTAALVLGILAGTTIAGYLALSSIQVGFDRP